MYSVMLVDNEPIIPKGLMQMIDWRAYSCRVTAVAKDGLDAVHQMQESLPDIVITDIRMPEMDGLQLCAWIQKNHPQIPVILLTGFPDFEYAKQAIRYGVVDFVLKPTTEESLIQAVTKACQKLNVSNVEDSQRSLRLEQQMLLGELIFHNRHSLLYTLNRVAELHIPLESYFVLSICVLSKEEKKPETEMLEEAQEIVSQAVGEQRVYFVSHTDNCCYAVLCTERDADPYVQCVDVVNEADQTVDFVLTIGISRRHSNPVHMAMAAKEADDAQQFTLYNSQPSVMRCENLPELSEDTAHSLSDKLRFVESAMENRNPEAAQKGLEQMFALCHSEKIPFSGMRQVGQILMNFCGSLLFSLGLSDEGILHDYSELRSVTSSQLEQELREMVVNTLTYVSQSPDNIDGFIYDVKQYVDKNYSTDLSLEMLADHVHLSSSYLSKLFKREMGENLSTYILNTRIKHAKTLLLTTKKKAYEVAEAVGIDDPVYFSKIFKKATGVKPSDFRNQSSSE